MKYENLIITKFKKSNNLTVTYEGEDKREYSITDEQIPHPDLVKALSALNNKLAESFYVNPEYYDKYECTGFTKIIKGEIEYILLTGKVKNPDDNTVGISSGHIDVSSIEKEFKKLCTEILEYFFKQKTAQAKLDF